jgi:hypothetical protein
VRGELFKPDDGVRSEAMVVQLDCRNLRLSLGDISGFERHNLAGRRRTLTVDHAWHSPSNGADANQMQRLCDVAAALSRKP